MAATAEEAGVDPEDQVVDVVAVVEVLVQGHSRTGTIHRLPPLLMVLIGPLKPGQAARNNNKVFKNQKWVSFNLHLIRNYFSSKLFPLNCDYFINESFPWNGFVSYTYLHEVML